MSSETKNMPETCLRRSVYLLAKLGPGAAGGLSQPGRLPCSRPCPSGDSSHTLPHFRFSQEEAADAPSVQTRTLRPWGGQGGAWAALGLPEASAPVQTHPLPTQLGPERCGQHMASSLPQQSRPSARTAHEPRSILSALCQSASGCPPRAVPRPEGSPQPRRQIHSELW